jgi:regulatory protein
MPWLFAFKAGERKRMRKITALRAGKGRSKRVNIHLDGKYAFSIETETALKEGLRVQQELSEDRIEELSRADSVQRCYNAAALLLSYRPRSEPELTERLRRRGFTGDAIEQSIAKLRKQGFVDDTAFARFWKENRDDFSPRSQRLTGLELKRKGVDEEIINRVVNTIDDDDSAYRAGLKKVRTLTGSDYEKFRRRLGDHLRRRGFSYDVIRRTVARLWQDRENSPDN